MKLQKNGATLIYFSRRVLLPMAFLLIASCASDPTVQGPASVNGMTTSAYEFNLEDGRKVWHIECPGWANSWGNCWARANHLCTQGFTLISQSTSEGGVSGVATQQVATVGQRTERLAVVRCN